jgi:hypothetical protein
MKTRGGFLLALAAVAAALSACGGGDDSGSGGEPSSITSKGVDFAYDMPSKISGGLTKIEYVNAGKQFHEWALARIKPGHTAAEVRQYLDKKGPNAPPPPWVTDVGGVGVMSPGQRIGITRDLKPGSYAFICFLPGPGGKPHYALGMFKGFQVQGNSGAKPPKVDGTITAKGSGFEISFLKPGEQTIELRNDSKTPFGFSLFEQKPGHQLTELRAFFKSGNLNKQPPAIFLGGAQSIPPGQSYYLDLNIQPGRQYLVIDPEKNVYKIFSAE